MSGALALRDDQHDWTDVQRAALAQIGVADAPRPDQLVFLHVCQRLGLDPFARQIYMIGRKDKESGTTKWTIQTGIDGFRVFSERHPQYGGALNPEWCGEDGVWKDVWLDKKPPTAARFTVIRRDQQAPISAIALYREYVQVKYGGEPNTMWTKMPAGQLAKCAEALARRRAFPRDLAGIYTDDEMGQADNPPPVIIAEATREATPTEPDWDAEIETRRGDAGRLKELLDLARGIRRNDGALLNQISQAWQDAKNAAAADATTQPPSQGQTNRMFALLSKGGLTSDANRHKLAARLLDREVTSFKDLTANDVSKVIRELERLDADGRLIPNPPAEQPRPENDPT